MRSNPVLLVTILAVALNTYRLHRKRARGASASHDGEESPVTDADVLTSAGFLALLLVVWLWGVAFGGGP